MKWRVISADALHFSSWNDEYVVYNSLSGDTHLLSSSTAQALLKLQQAPLDEISLAEVIAPFLHITSEDELALEIEHLLSDLNRLALIERA